ncbi:MAG: SDR family oxidoreductase [Desulfatirhabdiaceae bacterium]
MRHFRDPSKSLIIFSISSDIGLALARCRLSQGWRVSGTYRHYSAAIAELETMGAEIVQADFTSRKTLSRACHQLCEKMSNWDEIVLAPGILEPIGIFNELCFDEWSNSIHVNFINQLYVVHQMLAYRKNNALVIFFAGGGTNGIADRFSAYTISKIALIKMTELLDSEIPDARFVVVGPGWIRTKIHDQTLRAREKAGNSFDETTRRLLVDDFGTMETVIDCLDWISVQNKSTISGRNISVSYDGWGEENFVKILRNSPDAGKLRRFSNDLLNRNKSK